jgi:hypothetical protein
MSTLPALLLREGRNAQPFPGGVSDAPPPEIRFAPLADLDLPPRGGLEQEAWLACYGFIAF